MSSTYVGARQRLRDLVVACVIAIIAGPVFAQESSGSNPNVLVPAGGVDVANQYVFRGVRQNSTGIAVWPFTDLTARILSREGTLRRIEASLGFWNSLNTGDTGADGPAGQSWYESRLSGTLALQFSRGVSVAATYTAYVSPNDMFSTVNEVGVRLALDDRGALGARAVNPYALFAFEVDTSPGMGQLDGGLKAGRYLELGATPGYSGRYARVAFPVRVGLSLSDYYELGREDNTFGFVSVAGIVTVPLGRQTRVGRWHVHGGLEFQALGETTKVFNGGDRSAVVASFGVGLKP
jgi:hypothetical protein